MSNKVKIKSKKVSIYKKIINPFSKVNGQMSEEEKAASGRVYFTCEDNGSGGFQIASHNMWEYELPNFKMSVTASDKYKSYCMDLMLHVVLTVLQQGAREIDGHFALEEHPNGPLKFLFDFEESEEVGMIIIKPHIDDGHKVTYNRKKYIFNDESMRWERIEDSD